MSVQLGTTPESASRLTTSASSCVERDVVALTAEVTLTVWPACGQAPGAGRAPHPHPDQTVLSSPTVSVHGGALSLSSLPSGPCEGARERERGRDVPAPPRRPPALGRKDAPVRLRSAGPSAMPTAAAGSPRRLGRGPRRIPALWLWAGGPGWASVSLCGRVWQRQTGGGFHRGRCQLLTPQKRRGLACTD